VPLFFRVYTSVLLKHLAKPIDITKLFRIVTTEVQKQQAGDTNPMKPWYNANLLGGEEDIVLVTAGSPAGGGGGGGGGGGAAAAPLRADPAAFFPGYEGGALTGHCVKMLKHGGRVYGLAVLEGGQLVSGGENNTHLRVWDPTTGMNAATMVGKGYKIATLPGGRFAAAGYDTKRAAVWDLESPAHPVCEYTGHTAKVHCVVSLSDNLVASGSDDRTVHIWKADTGAHVTTLQGHTHWVNTLAVLSDGRLASGSLDNTVRLWDVSNPASAPRVLQHVGNPNALAVLDRGILATGCGDYKVYLWDVNSTSDQPMALLEGHTSWVLSLAALPRGLLASGSFDMTARVWNVAARTCVAVLEGHTGSVCAMAALLDGRLAVSGSDDGDIRVWELRP
jgi:WD40 repeat protein